MWVNFSIPVLHNYGKCMRPGANFLSNFFFFWGGGCVLYGIKYGNFDGKIFICEKSKE